MAFAVDISSRPAELQLYIHVFGNGPVEKVSGLGFWRRRQRLRDVREVCTARGRRSITYRRADNPFPPFGDLALHCKTTSGRVCTNRRRATPLTDNVCAFRPRFLFTIYIIFNIAVYDNNCLLYVVSLLCVLSIFYCVHAAAAAELIKLYAAMWWWSVGRATPSSAGLVYKRGCGAKWRRGGG